MARAVVTLTVGVSGSGKTYLRAGAFLDREFLPDRSARIHYSNFPLILPWWEERCEEKGWDLMRIQLIPNEVMDSWRRGESGPWEYFHGIDLTGCHVAIDEIHNFCGKETAGKIRKLWSEWIGEIRHRSCTVEFLTQAPSKVAREIEREAHLRYRIVNQEEERDPFLRIRMQDWYELRGAWMFGRKYIPTLYTYVEREVLGKWKIVESRPHLRTGEYYASYDSYSAPIAGTGHGGSPPVRVCEEKGRLATTVWFLLRYKLRMVAVLLCVLAAGWLTFGGGIGTIIQTSVEAGQAVVTGSMKSTAAGLGAKAAEPAPAAGTVSPPRHEAPVPVQVVQHYAKPVVGFDQKGVYYADFSLEPWGPFVYRDGDVVVIRDRRVRLGASTAPTPAAGGLLGSVLPAAKPTR
jgi:hypothetical protein